MLRSLQLALRRASSRHASAAFVFVLLAIGARAACADTGAALPAYAPPANYVARTEPLCVVFADLNGDGKTDMVVANSGSNGISVRLGNGDGTLGDRTDIVTGNGPTSVAVADVNGDGKPDVVVTNRYDMTLSVLLGHGDGTFGPGVLFDTGWDASCVAIADVNRDGFPDLAVVNYGNWTVSVMLGRGDGTFGARSDFDTGINPQFVAIGDLDGDGVPDLAVANRGYFMSTGGCVSFLWGIGDGTFADREDLTAGTGCYSVAIADYNHDGRPDLAVANAFDNTVSVLLGDGHGAFAAKTDYPTATAPVSVAAADLDHDGHLDLVTANYLACSTSILMGQGDGTFGAMTEYPADKQSFSVAIADLNGDTQLDLATANYSSSNVSVFLHTRADLPTATLVELLRASSTPQGIRVEWELSDPAAIQSVGIERGLSADGAWARMQQPAQVDGRLASVLDPEGAAGQEQWYRLAGVQRDGRPFTFGPVSALAQGLVTAAALAPLSPNPSSGRSLVSVAVPRNSRVRLSIADVQGREVAVLADSERAAGRYTAALDASDLRSGMYFVRMQSDGVNLTRRLSIVR